MATRNSQDVAETTEFTGQVTAEEMEAAAEVKGRNASRYSDTDLRAIGSFEEALALAQTVVGAELVDAAEEIGNGFVVLPTNDKARLINVPFVILSLDFNVGENGPWVSCMIVTKHGERLILNDGSTGIYQQLQEWYVKSSDRPGGMVVPAGLRRSDYDYTDAEGKSRGATTFYLAV